MSNNSKAFVLAARNALSFLEDDHGFALTELRSKHPFYKVTYRKQTSSADDLFVCLSTAPVRLEQDLDCGRGWPPEYHNTINVFELLAIEEPNSNKLKFTSGVYRFGDAQRMSDQYVEWASVLRKHGGRFFASDHSLWDAVHQLRESRIQQRENEETSRMAESAFKQSEWQQAIALLESLGDNRTKLQAARLAYARTQAAK